MATKEEMLAQAAQRKLAKMKYERELDERLAAESGEQLPYRHGQRNRRDNISELEAESFQTRVPQWDELSKKRAEEQRAAWGTRPAVPEALRNSEARLRLDAFSAGVLGGDSNRAMDARFARRNQQINDRADRADDVIMRDVPGYQPKSK